MSELPSGWTYACLPELISSNGVFVDGDWIESKDQDQDGNVRLIQLADIGDGRYVNKSNRFLTHAKATELGCTFLHRGDVLIARMPDPLGRACIFPGDRKEAVTVVDVCVVRGESEHFDHAWLMHFINSSAFRADIHSLQSGSTRRRISRGNLSTLKLPVPPRAEQSRIVTKLEELLSGLDAGVAELKAAQKKLAQYRQSLLKAAVEGALTAQWRKHNQPAETGAQLLERILQERRARWEARQLAKFAEQGKTPPKDWQKKYPEPVQPDTTGLPELPQGWVWVTAEMLFSWGSGDFLPASAQVGGDYPVYGGNGINGRHNEANVEHSTIVIGRVGVHCGNVYLTESSAWITDNAIYATSKHDLITWPYAELVMQAARLGTSSKGGAQPFISQKILNDTVVAMPPVEEQELICKEYSAVLKANEVMEQSIDLSLKQSTAQRQNILRAAFSGQLVQQDPNDEPASALLERIRAERAARDAVKMPRGRKGKEASDA